MKHLLKLTTLTKPKENETKAKDFKVKERRLKYLSAKKT